MNFLQAIILGIVQGLTEFLPVSSSAHVQIASELMKVPGLSDKNSATTAFIATIQLGTEAAVLIYFAKDISRLVTAWFKGLFNKSARATDTYKMSWFVIIASIPVGIAGLLLKHFIEETVRTLWVIAFTMILFGLILLLADRLGSKQKAIKELTFGSAIGFGLGQMLSVIPGVSRSGASISFGLLAGFNRAAAARFSFLIGIPAVLASGLIEFKDSYQNLDSTALTGTLIATVTSFLVGYAVIAGLLKYLNKGSFMPFVIWRVIVGISLLVMLSLGLVAA
ncbi:MAG: undecaprenyl-diphosphate phosphatase [Micrococcales bacterium]|jgi:undecaprenyl-diphosphatase|nr:undecaprenyl-diphosphate phosphatase [Actinomycetota bacterium]NCA07333.1 undecaprenyl-diphosphate phosphatase [Micrococcales bacterium]